MIAKSAWTGSFSWSCCRFRSRTDTLAKELQLNILMARRRTHLSYNLILRLLLLSIKRSRTFPVILPRNSANEFSFLLLQLSLELHSGVLVIFCSCLALLRVRFITAKGNTFMQPLIQGSGFRIIRATTTPRDCTLNAAAAGGCY